MLKVVFQLWLEQLFMTGSGFHDNMKNNNVKEMFLTLVWSGLQVVHKGFGSCGCSIDVDRYRHKL